MKRLLVNNLIRQMKLTHKNRQETLHSVDNKFQENDENVYLDKDMLDVI